MWQSVFHFLSEWLRGPYWGSGIGIVGGFLLFLLGIIYKVPRDRIFGLTVMGLCLIAGILLYFYG
jgi:hypothetical protein